MVAKMVSTSSPRSFGLAAASSAISSDLVKGASCHQLPAQCQMDRVRSTLTLCETKAFRTARLLQSAGGRTD
jgi:hypothetical protein